MGQNKKYYWLKLKENFFEEKQIKYLRSLQDGDKIVIAYLKMQLKSLKTEGFIKYDSILPSNIDELAMVLDENTNIIKLMIGALQKVNAVEILDDGSFYMIAMQDLIGKEGESAERVRRFREKERQLMPVKSEAKTNAERQKAFRAKKACEEKQYIPFIEDYINNKRYNGNYYIVMKRDAFKCRICGSIENLCVHHIDGFNELKLENSNANKLLTLCRCCHRQIHEGLEISKDILESIDYFNESNESNDFCNGDVTNCNTEIEKDIDKEKEKEIEIEKNIKKEKKKKETEFDSVINENFTDEELKQTIYEFIKMRKAIKKPMTTRALELLIEKLNKMASNEKEKIAILNQSIEHCWQTIYVLKEPLPKEENIAEEIYYNASDLTEEQYAMLMRGELSKGELRKILEEK